MTEKHRAFMRDLQAIVNKHHVTIDVTDDGRPWGQRCAMVEIYIEGAGVETLPGYICPEVEGE